MCIILVKPAGVEMPDYDNCWDNNDDGAGFMLPDNRGAVIVRKGFMTKEKLDRALSRFGDLTDRPVILHFRITTHGGTSKKMTHPFPISTKLKKVSTLSTVVPRAFVHNGIISLTTHAKKESDTSLFVREYLALLFEDKGRDYKLTPGEQVLVENLLGSKGAMLYGDGSYQLFGTFEQGDDGCLYSNSTYKYSYRSNWLCYTDDAFGSTPDYACTIDSVPRRRDTIAEQAQYCDGNCDTCMYEYDGYCQLWGEDMFDTYRYEPTTVENTGSESGIVRFHHSELPAYTRDDSYNPCDYCISQDTEVHCGECSVWEAPSRVLPCEYCTEPLSEHTCRTCIAGL